MHLITKKLSLLIREQAFSCERFIGAIYVFG